jgi:hypothetical protein
MMKETVGSLKAYFIVVSILGISGSVVALGSSQVNPLFLVTGLIGLAFSVAYLYVGITLRKLLVESPKLIDNMLFTSMAYQVITFLLSLLNGFQTGLVIQLAISLLLLWYLLSSVRRLSKEVKSKAQSE